MQTIIAVIGTKILKQSAVKFPRKSRSASHKNTCLLNELCTTTSKMEAFCCWTLFPPISRLMHLIANLLHSNVISGHQKLLVDGFTRARGYFQPY